MLKLLSDGDRVYTLEPDESAMKVMQAENMGHCILAYVVAGVMECVEYKGYHETGFVTYVVLPDTTGSIEDVYDAINKRLGAYHKC